ncbi:GNAT family N-acetyltransferase [Actinomycetospora corticicola]|uniref:GNAT superfamily N-acetyltransferase n=1 Tax=Actinomycetospora corticicola TaxID=663602 RepID=A0A7Y9DSY2_9PSEU|nr:GNAT superfamily N-acetyltransferase [Actinomycetospora corticicola]
MTGPADSIDPVDHRALEITDDPRPEDLTALKDALRDSTPTRADDGYRTLAIFVHDDGLVGGIAGYTHFSWLFVQQLWVDGSRRGTGLGSALLRAAEDEARRRECRGVWLDTYSFQARPFYEAHGYEVFGEIADYPPGHAKYFLKKAL